MAAKTGNNYICGTVAEIPTPNSALSIMASSIKD